MSYTHFSSIWDSFNDDLSQGSIESNLLESDLSDTFEEKDFKDKSSSTSFFDDDLSQGSVESNLLESDLSDTFENKNLTVNDIKIAKKKAARRKYYDENKHKIIPKQPFYRKRAAERKKAAGLPTNISAFYTAQNKSQSKPTTTTNLNNRASKRHNRLRTG